MGFAIVSDIHSNLAAFQAVLDDIESLKQKVKVDQIYCLGDIIGYGCQPVQVLNLVRQHICSNNIVVGNHEDLYWDNLADDVNDKARLMVEYNRHLIDKDEQSSSFLNSLNHNQHYVRTSNYERYRLFITHNGLDRDYLTYRYPWHDSLLPGLQAIFEEKAPDLLGEFEERASWAKGIKSLISKPNTDLFFFGHTHFPTIAFRQGDGTYTSVKPNGEFSFDEIPGPNKKLLINPGSVGYSRDNNPAASYMVIDDKKQKLIHRRVQYRCDISGYEEASDWLIENYKDRDKLGTNKIWKLVDNVRATAELGTFAVDPRKLAYDGWIEYYRLQDSM